MSTLVTWWKQLSGCHGGRGGEGGGGGASLDGRFHHGGVLRAAVCAAVCGDRARDVPAAICAAATALCERLLATCCGCLRAASALCELPPQLHQCVLGGVIDVSGTVLFL